MTQLMTIGIMKESNYLALTKKVKVKLRLR